jgi:flagellar brake protein
MADAPPAPGTDPWGPYRVDNLQERLALLRELSAGPVPIVLNLPDGSAVNTVLWAVEPERQRLTFSAETHPEALDRLVEADEALAVAYLASVKLQFDLQDLVVVHGNGHKALHARLPDTLYRFQRRNAYRVRNIQRSDAVVRLRHPSMPDMLLTLRLLDVSIGGCALWLPADVPLLPAGTELGDVLVQLDAETRFHAATTLQHVTAVGSGERLAEGVRIGCEWHALGGTAQRVLQRWIDRAQQRQRVLRG